MAGCKILKTGESEVIIKKSRFLGTAAEALTEEDAQKLVADIRKTHYSARHVCYAYSIGDENPRLKFLDDGEPGGTAGRPILDVIQNSGISNIVIVVVRYFGGVLLGTGGLVRAYTQAAQEAVQAADTKEIRLSNIYELSLDYSELDKIKYILDNTENVSYDISYSDKVLLNVIVPEELSDALMDSIVEKTAGRSSAKFIEKKMI